MAKAVVCKTIIHRFDSGRRLQKLKGFQCCTEIPFFVSASAQSIPVFTGTGPPTPGWTRQSFSSKNRLFAQYPEIQGVCRRWPEGIALFTSFCENRSSSRLTGEYPGFRMDTRYLILTVWSRLESRRPLPSPTGKGETDRSASPPLSVDSLPADTQSASSPTGIPQISSEYCLMVRSVENLPILATFSMAILVHFS